MNLTKTHALIEIPLEQKSIKLFSKIFKVNMGATQAYLRPGKLTDRFFFYFIELIVGA